MQRQGCSRMKAGSRRSSRQSSDPSERSIKDPINRQDDKTRGRSFTANRGVVSAAKVCPFSVLRNWWLLTTVYHCDSRCESVCTAC
eukprot:scaffold626_cov337-Pavlova_lutheri.AAC.60